MGTNTEELSITAQNTWTEWVTPTGPKALLLIRDVSSMSLTVSVQLSGDDGTTAVTSATTYTAEDVISLDVKPGVAVRAGVATGDYTSGTVGLRIVP